MSEVEELEVELDAAGWAVPKATLEADAEPKNPSVIPNKTIAIPSVNPTPFSALTECMAGDQQIGYITALQ